MYESFELRAQGRNQGQDNKLKGNGMQVFAISLMKELFPLESQDEVTIRKIQDEYKRSLMPIYAIHKAFFLEADGEITYYDQTLKTENDKVRISFDRSALENKTYTLRTKGFIKDHQECGKCKYETRSGLILANCKKHPKFRANYLKKSVCTMCDRNVVMLKECPECGGKLAIVLMPNPAKEIFRGEDDKLISYLQEENFIGTQSLGHGVDSRADSIFSDKNTGEIYIVECKNKEFTGVNFMDALSTTYYIRAVKAILGKNIPLTLIYNGEFHTKAFNFIARTEGMKFKRMTICELCNMYSNKTGKYFKRIVARKKQGLEGEISFGGDASEYCVYPEYSKEWGKTIYVDIVDEGKRPSIMGKIAKFMGKG
jgi:hypothetical protein